MRSGDRDALALAKTWSKLAAVLFAIGAVSGTALSFELGLLWPRFMLFTAWTLPFGVGLIGPSLWLLFFRVQGTDPSQSTHYN
jgi:cytochrome bd-type quinol oxidase subunit 1